MKTIIMTALAAAAILLVIVLLTDTTQPIEKESAQPDLHLYVSWDTMEFDKCLAAWLIVRFIDNQAKFKLVANNTEITEGIPFDVPGADWSRKHRQCTSQCVLQSIPQPDDALKRLVTMASRTELNFWQLDRWPGTQRCFYQVKEIIDSAPGPDKCFQMTHAYFDELYQKLKSQSPATVLGLRCRVKF